MTGKWLIWQPWADGQADQLWQKLAEEVPNYFVITKSDLARKSDLLEKKLTEKVLPVYEEY